MSTIGISVLTLLCAFSTSLFAEHALPGPAASGPKIEAPAPRPREVTKYYMVMFATEGAPHPEFRPLRPRQLRNFFEAASQAHTFMTVLKVSGRRVEEEKTISWLPAPGYFWEGNSMPRRGIVPGHNYTLDETLALNEGHAIRAWGPYEISEDFFLRVSARVDFLGRGQTGYKMMVPLRHRLREPALNNEPGGAINCIMAVSDVCGPLDTGTAFGFPASWAVLNHCASGPGNLVNPSATNPNILKSMRLFDRAAHYGLTFR